MAEFKIISDMVPRGDQPAAIEQLVQNLRRGQQYNVLLGVTGSGKTFTMANVIERLGKPTLIISHNKTLAAQLYNEFKELFPNNAVEYFVSYYDYYQPEAYMPRTDTYIEKDASINEEIDRLRLAATSSLFSRSDVVIVAGGLTAYVGLDTPAVSVGAWTMAVDFLLVLVFSGTQPIRRPGDVVKRFADGLKGLAGFSGMFGDILSYLRLFALGLASGSLGMTLNSLAGQVSDMGSRKGIALLLGLLVLLLGHALNLSLGIIGGVVHGLRLNLIEFYKWSVFEEGTAFQAFRKKENVTWKP